VDSRKNDIVVDIDMPKELPVTPEELALVETYLRDIIAEMVKAEATR
tara:strand:- start:1647 stop:1787 length:141 start_codon:yes stop_codon:yes gene_type:complete